MEASLLNQKDFIFWHSLLDCMSGQEKKKQCPYKCRRELARVIYTWMHKLLLQCFSPQLPDWNFLGHSSINLEDRTALVKIRSALSLKHSLFDRATVYGRKKSMQQVAALQMNSMHLVVWKHKWNLAVCSSMTPEKHWQKQKPALTL